MAYNILEHRLDSRATQRQRKINLQVDERLREPLMALEETIGDNDDSALSKGGTCREKRHLFFGRRISC